MPIEIHPRRLFGPWSMGFALDLHTSGSAFTGSNAPGYPMFDTTRSPLGELVYGLKVRGDLSKLEPIAEAASRFLRSWSITVDAIVPVPPSNTLRRRQPVLLAATEIAKRTGKVKKTGQLKDLVNPRERATILSDAFSVDSNQTEGRTLLVFDDLYRSGATAAAITRLLLGEGSAKRV